MSQCSVWPMEIDVPQLVEHTHTRRAFQIYAVLAVGLPVHENNQEAKIFRRHRYGDPFWICKPTYPHGIPRRNRRIVMQIVNHSNCRSRSSQLLSQIACLPMRHGICCTGSRPHANASPYTIDPKDENMEKLSWMIMHKSDLIVTPLETARFSAVWCTHLRIDADNFVAFVACVGKHIFVAFNAVRMIVAKNIPLSGQAFVTLPAAEVARVPILGHGFGVFATEN